MWQEFDFEAFDGPVVLFFFSGVGFSFGLGLFVFYFECFEPVG